MKFPFRFLFFNWSRREKERKEERKKEYELIFFPPVFFCFRRQSWMAVCPANKNKPTKWNDLHFSLTCCWMVIIISGSFKTRLVGERISEKRRNSLEIFKYLSEKKQKRISDDLQIGWETTAKRIRNDFEFALNALKPIWNDFKLRSEFAEKWLQVRLQSCSETIPKTILKLSPKPSWNYPETAPKLLEKLSTTGMSHQRFPHIRTYEFTYTHFITFKL